MPSLPALVVLLTGLGFGLALLASAVLEVPEAQLRVLLGAFGVALVLGAVLLARHLRDGESRVAALATVLGRLADRQFHHFAPSGGSPAVRRLAAEVNRLGDMLRRGHLSAEEELMYERAMVRESPNGLLVIDGAGRVLRANPAIFELVPVRGDPVGRPPIATIAVPELQEVVEETTRTRVPAERTARVGPRDLLLRAFPLADGAGCLGVVLDVSSIRRAERARRDFVSNVSHELRTPITALVGYAEALLDDREALPPSAAPMLEAIDRNARRLGALVEDVLQLSKIEARDADLTLDPEPVLPLVEEVLARFAPQAAQKGVRLALGAHEDAEALLNTQAFEHALNNLVDNAIKYTPAGGAVTVSVAREGERVRVDVADTGIGIAEVHHERIFERFYRVDPGRARDVGGTGLGLALVKHLCQATRSEVGFTSAPGKGSTFTLRLPTA